MIRAIKSIVEETITPAGRAFDLFIQSMIVLSLVSFSIETLPNLTEKSIRTLNIIETITVIIFTIEYLLRLAVADRKIKFIFSFYGLIDLLAIMPFYIARGIDLRSIRIVRLLRLLRTFKIFRYSKALLRMKDALWSVKEEMILFLVATFFLLYISAVGIYYFENPAQPEQFKSIFHCLWWAIITLTTIGYGDVYPITLGGKIFTSIIAIIGIGVIAVPTGLLASALTKTRNDNE